MVVKSHFNTVFSSRATLKNDDSQHWGLWECDWKELQMIDRQESGSVEFWVLQFSFCIVFVNWASHCPTCPGSGGGASRMFEHWRRYQYLDDHQVNIFQWKSGNCSSFSSLCKQCFKSELGNDIFYPIFKRLILCCSTSTSRVNTAIGIWRRLVVSCLVCSNLFSNFSLLLC